jgi:hypothetical protein
LKEGTVEYEKYQMEVTTKMPKKKQSKQSKARKLAKSAGVDVGMIEKYNPNYYKKKKKK